MTTTTVGEPLRLADAPWGEPTTLPVGAVGPDFSQLLGADSRRYGLADFADQDLLVLIFTSNRCPTAKAYAGRLRDLHARFAPRGAGIVLINSNDPYLYPEESYERTVVAARESGFGFPYLFDEGQHVARAYGPQRTFHAFVLDRDRRLRYEGRFDDARLPERVTTHDLENALEDLLADRPVAVPQTKPFGCSLDIL